MTNNAGKNHFLLSLLAVMATLASAEARPAAQPHVPKLVVNILIDQLRSDYVEAFMPLYGEGGFRRLFEEGCVYTRGEYPMVQPDRASAAATVAAGTTPYNHGVTGRQWFDRATLRPVQSVDDRRYADTEGVTASAPTSLAVSTLSDELKMATGGRALVYSIAPYRDMAVLAAGHAGDAAVWIDNRTGNWCTSSYYGTKPAWVTSRNEYGAIGKLLKAVKWLPYSQASESFSYFQQSGAPTSFDHKFRGEGQFRSFKTSALVNEDVEALAEGCLSATALGQDEATDYLAVAFYAGTVEHRSVNEGGAELQDTYVRLDRAIAQLIAAVERKVGTNRALFVVTSTGYSDASAAGMEQYRVPCGTFDMGKASALLNMYLVAIYGQGQYVEGVLGRHIYLNHKLIEDKQIRSAELLTRAQEFLLQLSGVKDVYTSLRLQLGVGTEILGRVRNGYNVATCGDLLIEVAPGWRFVNEETYESQFVRAAYVPFPIILYGTGVSPAVVSTPVSVDRIAPTLSKAMRIRAPNACEAIPLALQ